MKYVLLLRGVNVGGNRKVAKSDLKKVLESLGFTDILVYINSGNVIFSSDKPVIIKMIEDALEQYFGFFIPSLVLSEEKIVEIAAAIPEEWRNDAVNKEKSGMKSDVLYLFDEVNYPGILNEIEYNPEIESMIYLDGAIITMISREKQAQGSLQNIIGKKFYKQITIRNVNTARKLAELVCED